MSVPRQAMHIKLSTEQTERLLEWVREWSAPHWEADCEPPGYGLEITVLGGWPPWAAVNCGNVTRDLGCVAIEFVDEP